MKKLLIFIITGMAVCIVHSRPVEAAPQLTLGITPTIKELIIDPGKSQSAVVAVTNLSKSPLPIRANASSLTPLEPIYNPAAQKVFDASSWFSFTTADFILQPNQTTQITINVAVPPNAEPGGHYSTVYFQPLQTAETLKQNTAYFTQKVGVLVLVVVKGDITRNASIAHFRAPMFAQGDVQFDLALQNRGNVHLTPAGTVAVRNLFGKKVAEVLLPPGLLLPYTTRTYPLEWQNKQFGFFKATLSFGYDTPTSQVTQTINFWLLPWWLIDSMGIIIAATLFTVTTRKRWRRAFKVLWGKSYKRNR